MRSIEMWVILCKINMDIMYVNDNNILYSPHAQIKVIKFRDLIEIKIIDILYGVIICVHFVIKTYIVLKKYMKNKYFRSTFRK